MPNPKPQSSWLISFGWQSLETLSAVDTVIFDKTGTLTCSKLGVSNMCARRPATVVPPAITSLLPLYSWPSELFFGQRSTERQQEWLQRLWIPLSFDVSSSIPAIGHSIGA